MRKANFEFKQVAAPVDSATHYLTEAHQNFDAMKNVKGSSPVNEVNEANNVKNYSHKEHFKFGTKVEPMVSSKQMYEVKPHQMRDRAELSKEKLNDLKKVHYKF